MRQVGGPRTWPTDPASAAQLDLLGLLDTGEVRVRTTTGYEWLGLTFRPERSDAPDYARIFCDPDDIRSITLVHDRGPKKGTSGGDATLRGFPLDTAIPIALAPHLRAQADPVGIRTGADRISDLLGEAEKGGPTKTAGKKPGAPNGKAGKKRASAVEEVLRAARRNARAHALPIETPSSPVRDEDELVLAAQPVDNEVSQSPKTGTELDEGDLVLEPYGGFVE